MTTAVNRNLSNCEIAWKKFFGASTGFEPVASAFALQCSTSWAMKTHTLEACQFIELINPWKEPFISKLITWVIELIFYKYLPLLFCLFKTHERLSSLYVDVITEHLQVHPFFEDLQSLPAILWQGLTPWLQVSLKSAKTMRSPVSIRVTEHIASVDEDANSSSCNKRRKQACVIIVLSSFRLSVKVE